MATRLIAILLVLYSPLSIADPAVTWTPSHVSDTISPGESTTATVSFTSFKGLSDVVVRVVPELEPYIEVNPAEFSNIVKGQTYDIDLNILAPFNSNLDSIKGTIQLKSKRDSRRVFSKPLPIALNIIKLQEGQVSNDLVKVKFSVPQNWFILEENALTNNLYSPESAVAIDDGDLVTPPDMTISILENNNNLSLSDFVGVYKNGWFINYKNIETTSINGHDSIIVSDDGSQVPSKPIRAAFVAVDRVMVLITEFFGNEQEFNQVIHTLDLP